ncbi:hypothetical protein [Stenotrophomonas panacihumi]|uniref:hypothetical protein n=1 Tax=Stenotrophomonas panacihumi TaxID=676599 RepID=UPI000A7411D8|nr:hypothetical protein [Stenotrophomonas panacihumi]
MTKKQGVMLFALLWLGGCSCHRDPEATAIPEPAPEAAALPADNDEAAPETDAAPSAAERRARNAAFSAAVSVVHAYITALPARTGEADAMWTGGRPSPVPDDANLRSLEGLNSLRIESGEPTALDKNTPPQAVEVPVKLTARMSGGNRHYTGWYRLRPRVDGSGWEITSASLQPTLD